MTQSRTHARRHVIANWKGVTFHCFDIDRHLTGLQGQNGSGKTTVMAAYVTAILPNQRLLYFPNLTGGGSASKNDAGLWGKLGEDGVTYTIIEWVTPKGKSVWAGVAMTRGNMPAIDMKLFTVEDLPEVVDPYDAFLVREGAHITVPQLGRLREHLTMLGARVTTHRTLADYMRTLYEHGITPLPMTTHEEQERFYRVLSTSMAGSSLGSLARSGLKDYLLTDDSSLERRVSNMRESLEQCRQTKRELERAQESHTEIKSLYEAAWSMSSYAFFGALGRYEQANDSWKGQLKVTRSKRQDHIEKVDEVERLNNSVADLEMRLNETRLQLSEKSRERENKNEARRIRIDLESATTQHRQAEATYASASLRRDEARQNEELAKIEDRAAQSEYTRIAGELGDLQKAVEDLITRVTSLRVARSKLAAAQNALPDRHVDQINAPIIKNELDAEYDELTRIETREQSELDSFNGHKDTFDRLLSQIRQLAQLENGGLLDPEDAYTYAVQMDSRLRDNTAKANQLEAIASALAKAKSLACEQQQVLEKAHALGIDSSHALIDAVASLIADMGRMETELNGHKREDDEKQKLLLDVKGRLPVLIEAHNRFCEASDYRQHLRQLESPMGNVESMEALDAEQSVARAQLSAIRDLRNATEDGVRKTKDRIHSLRSQSGTMDPRISSVAEQLDGYLNSANFDELSPEDAATTQARIGLWAEAIVVDSPQHAAEQASTIEDRPDTLLFVSEKTALMYREARSLGDSELVTESGDDAFEGVRLTRRPDRPVLGRRAREAEISRLESELSGLETALKQLHEDHRKADQALLIASKLMGLGPGIWDADPEPALVNERGRERGLEAAILKISGDIRRVKLQYDELLRQKSRYSELEARRDLIDLPNHKDEAVRLTAELAGARESKNWITRHEMTVKAILNGLPLLAKIPDESARQALTIKIKTLSEARAGLSFQRDALTHLMAVINDFRYTDDEKVYEEKTSIIESLHFQLEPAKQHQEIARQLFELSRDAYDRARGAFGDSEARLNQATMEKDRLSNKLEDTGSMGTDEECRLAQNAVTEASQAVDKTNSEHLIAVGKKAEHATLLKSSEIVLTARNKEASEKLSSLRKERHAKTELAQVVLNLRLNGTVDSEANRQQFFPTGSLINAFQESLVNSRMLIERLKTYPDVQNEVSEIAQFSEAAEERRAIQTLKVWERVHRHIEQRIPRNIASSDNPKIALTQMHDKMQELRRTLDAQESDMRMRSSGVSNAIRTRLRSAGTLITRLNRELDQVRFGSIRGVRIVKEEPLHMIEMIKALEDGGSLSLFDTETPLEETLAKIYERIGGGRTVGSKLLDYRNYINLRLEIKRINGKWDVTDGVSTGEAIGVGAAVLVMILRTWNDEAKRISGTSAGQSMQQILLDEANRLDPDALDTFTEFCQRMDVQALVAAPGLERPRRSTVFLLERGIVNNREQVTIRGQRITA